MKRFPSAVPVRSSALFAALFAVLGIGVVSVMSSSPLAPRSAEAAPSPVPSPSPSPSPPSPEAGLRAAPPPGVGAWNSAPRPVPNRWSALEALAPPRREHDPSAPVVDVAAEANRVPFGPPDLAPTIDVQITQEILDQAAELGSAQAMYEFVRNECAFQPYFGSRKGSVETLRQRAGNDYDLASLLIALLRGSGIPARYAVGTVEMSAARAAAWLGVDDAEVAGSILFTNGMEGTSIIDGKGQVVAVRAKRVWVEAFVAVGYGAASWIPLDPAFAQQDVQPGMDIPAAMGLDALAFVDDYWDPADPMVTLPRSETVVEVFESVVQDWLDTNLPGTTVAEVRRTSDRVTELLGQLPLSLPYTVRSRDTEYSEIPSDRRYQLRFHLRDGATTLIDHTLDLPAVAGRRVFIDYVGATPTDQGIIDANGGIYQTPPSTVDLTPVLRVAGADVATGAAGVGMGRTHEAELHFLAPTNGMGLPVNVVPSIFNTMVCGASEAHAFAIDGTAEALAVPPPTDDLGGLASLLWDTGMDYLAAVRRSDEEIASLLHGFVTTGVTNAIVKNVPIVTFDGGGNPLTFDWGGLVVDADRAVIGYWPVDGLQPSNLEPKDFLVIAGAEGSLYENLIYEDSYGQDSVSTMKILQLSIDAGLTVYKRWNSLPLPPNTLSPSAVAAIESAILSGNEVTFPEAEITVGTPATGEWTGTGWIDMNPANGAAGYIISGGLSSGAYNGGATVEEWPPEFIDLSEDDKDIVLVEIKIKGGVSPMGDSPEPDAIFTRDDEEQITFEYQVEVTYDDGSMKTLPSASTYYRKTTRNTTKTFVPGNYQFRVWIARRSWWFFQTTVAEAERNISIVGALIRKDDGSEFGEDPPKFLGVAPATGSPPSLPFRVLVIPEEAPDGTPLAQSYQWSGGPLLSFTAPMDERTDVEPAGMTASSSENDQPVEVVVDLPGGKQQKGYFELDFSRGGTDVPHEMTVVKLEVTEIFSEQLGGNECNSLPPNPGLWPPSVSENIPMIMAAVSNNTSRLSARTDLDVPASVLSKVKVGVVEQGSTDILHAEPAMNLPTKVVVEFDASPNLNPQDLNVYEVIVWLDENDDDAVQECEVRDVYDDGIRVVTVGDALQARLELVAAQVLLVGIAQDLVDVFLGGAGPPAGSNPGTTTINIGFPGLSHPLGATWGGSCTANVSKFTFKPANPISVDMAEQTRVVDFVKAELNSHHAAIQAYFNANPGIGSAVFPAALGQPPWAWSGTVSTTDWLSDLEPGIALGFGGTAFNGTIPSVTVEEGTLNVLSIRYDGGFTDLYDFNYNALIAGIPVCRPAAILQASWTLGSSGDIFVTEVVMDRTASPPDFTHTITP